MKATLNLKTRELTVVSKEIIDFKTVIGDNEFDYWDSLNSKKTGEPLYDINVWCDDYSGDGGDPSNPKNWMAQFVNLIDNGSGVYTLGSNYQHIDLKTIK